MPRHEFVLHTVEGNLYFRKWFKGFDLFYIFIVIWNRQTIGKQFFRSKVSQWRRFTLARTAYDVRSEHKNEYRQILLYEIHFSLEYRNWKIYALDLSSIYRL